MRCARLWVRQVRLYGQGEALPSWADKGCGRSLHIQSSVFTVSMSSLRSVLSKCFILHASFGFPFESFSSGSSRQSLFSHCLCLGARVGYVPFQLASAKFSTSLSSITSHYNPKQSNNSPPQTGGSYRSNAYGNTIGPARAKKLMQPVFGAKPILAPAIRAEQKTFHDSRGKAKMSWLCDQAVSHLSCRISLRPVGRFLPGIDLGITCCVLECKMDICSALFLYVPATKQRSQSYPFDFVLLLLVALTGGSEVSC